MKKRALVIAALSGFISTFLRHDIELLQARGYEVHCAGNAKNKNKEENDAVFREWGVEFHQIDFSSKSPISKESFISWKQVKTLLKEYDFDVIHCHTPIAGAITRFAAIPYRRKGTKVIYTSHGFYFHKGSGRKEWMIYYPVEKIMSIFTDAIITINREDYAVAEKMCSRLVFHINGVGCDTAKYRNAVVDSAEKRGELGIKEGQTMILDVGELSVRKNHGILIRALGELKDPDLVLVICGKAVQGAGTYEELKKTAEELGVNVVFAGHRADIPELCHCADFGALASTREGLGLSGIEMLSAGLPLVTSNVHGIKDYMVDGVTGYMCDCHDEKAFAEAIKKLCNADTRRNMKNACMQAALKFDNAVSFRQMEKIYARILD